MYELLKKILKRWCKTSVAREINMKISSLSICFKYHQKHHRNLFTYSIYRVILYITPDIHGNDQDTRFFDGDASAEWCITAIYLSALVLVVRLAQKGSWRIFVSVIRMHLQKIHSSNISSVNQSIFFIARSRKNQILIFT